MFIRASELPTNQKLYCFLNNIAARFGNVNLWRSAGKRKQNRPSKYSFNLDGKSYHVTAVSDDEAIEKANKKLIEISARLHQTIPS